MQQLAEATGPYLQLTAQFGLGQALGGFGKDEFSGPGNLMLWCPDEQAIQSQWPRGAGLPALNAADAAPLVGTDFPSVASFHLFSIFLMAPEFAPQGTETSTSHLFASKLLLFIEHVARFRQPDAGLLATNFETIGIHEITDGA